MVTDELRPSAVPPVAIDVTLLCAPIAVESCASAVAVLPKADASAAAALDSLPKAEDHPPVAFA